MRPWEHRSFTVATAIVAVTGLVYLYMEFFMQTDDPFALVNHPWQPSMLGAHVIAAPVLVLFFGMLFRSHTLKKLASPLRSNRRTGWTSLISFGSMASSGYLLQIVTSPMLNDALVVIHIVTSLLFVAGYAIHLAIGWRISWTSGTTSSDPVADTARLVS